MAAAAQLWGAVPTIDFSAFSPAAAAAGTPPSGPTGAAAAAGAPLPPPTAAQLATAARIDEVCRVHGFCKLRNVGISSEDTCAAFDAAKALFALPEEHKAAALAHFTAYPPGANRGYFPVRRARVCVQALPGRGCC
jgi:hypothetical protein